MSMVYGNVASTDPCVLYIVVNKCINYNLGFDTVQVGLGLNTAR